MMLIVQKSVQYGVVTLFVCFPECIVGFVIDSMRFGRSASSSSSDGFFLITQFGIDKTSNLSLFNCRFLTEGCKH